MPPRITDGGEDENSEQNFPPYSVLCGIFFGLLLIIVIVRETTISGLVDTSFLRITNTYVTVYLKPQRKYYLETHDRFLVINKG